MTQDVLAQKHILMVLVLEYCSPLEKALETAQKVEGNILICVIGSVVVRKCKEL